MAELTFEEMVEQAKLHSSKMVADIIAGSGVNLQQYGILSALIKKGDEALANNSEANKAKFIDEYKAYTPSLPVKDTDPVYITPLATATFEEKVAEFKDRMEIIEKLSASYFAESETIPKEERAGSTANAFQYRFLTTRVREMSELHEIGKEHERAGLYPWERAKEALEAASALKDTKPEQRAELEQTVQETAIVALAATERFGEIYAEFVTPADLQRLNPANAPENDQGLPAQTDEAIPAPVNALGNGEGLPGQTDELVRGPNRTQGPDAPIISPPPVDRTPPPLDEIRAYPREPEQPNPADLMPPGGMDGRGEELPPTGPGFSGDPEVYGGNTAQSPAGTPAAGTPAAGTPVAGTPAQGAPAATAPAATAPAAAPPPPARPASNDASAPAAGRAPADNDRWSVISLAGNTPAQIRAVQNALNSVDIKGKNGKSLVEDGVYGKNTEHAIKAFVEKHGLDPRFMSPEEFVESVKTVARGETPKPHNVTHGNTFSESFGSAVKQQPLPERGNDAQVRETQRLLTALGYPTKGVDGVWGRNTQNALSDFVDAQMEAGKADAINLSGMSAADRNAALQETLDSKTNASSGPKVESSMGVTTKP